MRIEEIKKLINAANNSNMDISTLSIDEVNDIVRLISGIVSNK